MRTRTHPMTPLAAVAGGLLAGAVGTVCLDTVQCREVPPQRRQGQPAQVGVRAGGQLGGSPRSRSGRQAPDRGLHPPELPDRWAWLTSTVAHWAYGSSAAALYGIVAGSLRRPHALYGLPLGAVVAATGYVVGAIYKPIWEYDAKTLAADLSGHLAYGAGTGVTFWLLAKAL